MRKIYLSLVLLISTVSFAQLPNPKDCSVETWANVMLSPPTITVNWLANATGTSYAVARKLKTSQFWTNLAVNLPSTTTQYVDNTAQANVEYEYRVMRSGVTGTFSYPGYGYISSGIEIPVVEARGKLILLIANTLSVSLANEINRLKDDLEGDGWEVLPAYVSTSLAVTAVKAQIVTAYNLDPVNTKAVFLLGHIPVPYSGNFGPDAHPDHQGAWPADVYYGDIDGLWSDVSVTSTTVSPARTQNIPGDGKFDPSIIPSAVELQVGRVDLFAMPSFTANEVQLLQNYLNKDHDYRKKIFSPVKRAVLDDNFGYFDTSPYYGGESFASSGYKNFGPLVTPTNVTIADYFTTMTGNGNSYQWSYGCGGGTYISAGGIGATSNFASADLQGTFTMLFGSYFGDWDVPDNFLRAPLCQGKTLTNAWAGRPNWMFHHMAMGENIGYSAQLTQNNNSQLYFASPYPLNAGIAGAVHIALMGDPTLRNDVVAPVSSVVATKSGNDCVITWAATTETSIVGYNIYMKNDTNTSYVRVNANPISALSYTDNCLLHPGIYKYMVRVLKLENTPSGTYYNMSEGIADTALNLNNLVVTAQAMQAINSNTVTFTNQSANATAYSWTLNTGATSTSMNPVYTYTANGTYTVTMIASNSCDADTYTTTVTITVIGLEEKNISSSSLTLYPNPASLKMTLSCEKCDNSSFVIYNTEGKKVMEGKVEQKDQTLDIHHLPKGLYLIKLHKDGKREDLKRFVIE
jgi:PKD repeat protein